MKKHSCVQQGMPFLSGENCWKGGSGVFRELKHRLDEIECPAGHQLTQKEFGELLGMKRSTTNDCYHSDPHPQIQYFLRALERFPEAIRLAVLRKLCRECPRLDHPRLAHDPQTVSILETVLGQRSGLTLIQGGDDELRSFVITALGHSARKFAAGTQVAGVDAHRPERFVPVKGVLYFAASSGAFTSTALAQAMATQIARGDARLLLFNAVWTACPDLHSDILRTTKRRHVVVADELGSIPSTKLSGTAVNVLNLQRKRGLIEIQSALGL